MLNPTWMLDDPNADPLLQQMEEERRRRAAEQSQAVSQPSESQPFIAPAIPTPAPAEDAAYDIERQQRDAQAQVDFAKAQAADAGIDLATGRPVAPQAQQTPAPLDTGISFKGGTGAVTEQVHSWDPLVQQASATFNVPTNVIKAIIDIESKGDPGATSYLGAAGLMQVMPQYHEPYGGGDLYDPATNIMTGARILADNYARYGTWEQAAAAYFGAINPDGSVSGASDGNADGYTYVDLFTQKANAYLSDQREQAPTYGPSLPAGNDARVFGDQRPSQLPEANPELSMDAAYAACGPAAAIVFAAMMGRPPTLKEATEIGRSIKAWDEGVGMYGPEAEIRLIEALGGRARFQPGLDPNMLVTEVANGNPVMLSSPRTANSEGHYAVVSGYDQASGRFYFGTSATDLKGGQAWMTLEEYQALRASGPVTGMILVDNPLANGPSAANERYGPSIPPSWDPSRQGIDKPQQKETDFHRLAREQWEAAQSLAVKVADQVERIREEARKQQASQVQAPPTEQYQPTDDPAQAEMLRQPLAQPDSARQDATPSQDPTDQFVARAREIEARYPGASPRPTDQNYDPAYELEATRLAREWQQSANPNAVQVEGMTAGVGAVKNPDGTYRTATPEEVNADPTVVMAQRELEMREQYLQRQLETRAEQAQVGNIWTLTPDEYTAWRKRQGLEIRPDEYQRHAIAVLEASQQGQAIPDKVKEAYGSEVKDRWQKDRRTALSPIASVANGAPYDGADAEHRYQGLLNLPTQIATVAQQTANAAALTVAGMIEGGLRAADAGAKAIERGTGLQSSGTFGRQADMLERMIEDNPQLQSPDRPPEGFVEGLTYMADPTRIDRLARGFGQLVPYILGGGAIRAALTPIFAATGMSGATLTAGSGLATSTVITGLPSFGQFYEEATEAKQPGQRKLSENEALVYAGVHAVLQMSIEAGLGRGLEMASGAVVNRSPILKKTSELTARNWGAQILGAGASESLEEGVQQIFENALSKVTYDPGRDILDGVGAAMGSTFGPSAAMGVGRARGEAREASFRYSTSLDAERQQQLREQVTDVASAEKFANEQLARTAAYGKSVGWDQRQIDAAQFRATQAIYGYGVDREIAARKLTDEQIATDPTILHGIFAVRLAKQFETRLNDRDVYEREQRIKERGQQIDALLEEEGIRFDASPEGAQAERRTAMPLGYTYEQNQDGSFRVVDDEGREAKVGNRPLTEGEARQIAQEMTMRSLPPITAPQAEAATVRSFEEVEAALDRGERPSDGFAGTRGGSSTATSRTNPTGPNAAFPSTTAKTGEYLAPGIDLDPSGWQRNTGGRDSLASLNPDAAVPVPNTDVAVMGRGGTPPSVLMRVANSTYAADYLQAARNILHGGDGRTGAMAILQRVMDKRRYDLKPEQRAPRAEPKIDALGAAVQEYYGWNLSPEGRGIGLNPAEMFHAAVVKVTEYEQLNGQLSDQERDETIVKEMASTLVSNVLHEGAHYYGRTDADVNESADHTGVFKTVHAPVEAIMALIDKGLERDSAEFAKELNDLAALAMFVGLRQTDILQIHDAIIAMREQAIADLREAFGTMDGSAGLKEINAHAFEQRMLASEAYVRQNYPQGVDSAELSIVHNQQPSDGDGGGGPGVSSGIGQDQVRDPGAGDDGVRLQRGEEVAPVGPNTQGADGLGPADAGVRADRVTNFKRADATSIGNLRGGLTRLVQAVNKLSPELKAEAIKKAAERWRRDSRGEKFFDLYDPSVLRWQLNVDVPAEIEVANALFEALYPGVSSDPSRYINGLADQAAAAIEANPDPVVVTGKVVDPKNPEITRDQKEGRVWGPETVRRYTEVGDDTDRHTMSTISLVLGELQRRGYLNKDFEEVAAERRRAAKPEAPPRRPTGSRQTASGRQGTDRQDTGQQGPTARPAREQGASETVDTAAGKINDDGWLDKMSRDTGTSWGNGLGEALIVASPADADEGRKKADRKATAARRNEMLDLIHERIKDLTNRLSALRRENLRTPIENEARKQEIADEIALLSKRRSVLRAISGKHGLGQYARRYTTLEQSENGPPSAVVRYRVAGDGTAVVVVEGIGAMVANEGLSAAEKTGFEALGRAVYAQRSPGAWGHDDEGKPLTMGQYLSQAIELLYPGQTISPEQYFADMQAVAKRWMAANPTADVTQPQLMAHLLLAHQSMIQQAMNAMTLAKARDKASGIKGELIKDEDGKVIGYGGPEYAEALRAMHELIATSALLPSIKKMATASSRTLRVLQAAEERNRARANLMALHEMRTTIREMIKRIEKAETSDSFDDLLTDLGIVARGGGGIGDALGRATTGELASELLVRPDGLIATLSDLYNRVTSVSDLNKHFKVTDDEGRHFLTKAQREELKGMLEREVRGETIPEADVRRMTDNIMRGGFRLWARREEGSTVGPDGRTRYASEKARWRAEGENYALELINMRVEGMTKSAVKETLRLLQDGKSSFLATFDEVMKSRPIGPDGKVAKTGMTREQLLAALYAKRDELVNWQRQNDPTTRVYKKAHPRMGASANTTATEESPHNLQIEMGENYRREISLDSEIRYLKQWLADAKVATGIAPADQQAWVAMIEAQLDERQAEMDEIRTRIDQLETDIVNESLGALIDAIDDAHAKRDEVELKMSDDQMTLTVAQHLGYAAAKRINHEMLRLALSNHDIGTVEAEARRLMKAHYHETADESNDVEYWVGFLEEMERKYGTSEDRRVQLRLFDLRERAATQLLALEEHPQYGEQMSTALKNRLLRAVHGDAGAFALGIRQQLTATGYLINETTYPDEQDRQYLLRDDVLAAVAGTRENPGPLARAMADRHDTQAMADLVAVLDSIAAEARGLGEAFRDAMLAGVDIEHRKAAIREMLPAVKNDPTDMALRYMVEIQLLELRTRLADRETQTWFRRRFGRSELALRREYERMIELGAQRIERDAERAAEAANTYDVLKAAGVETVADLTNAVDGKPPKKSASEIIIERRERMQARSIERRIRDIERQRGEDPDAFNRELLDDERDRLLIELESVGRYNDPETGEATGVGPKAAARLRDELVGMRQRAENRQEERQVGWEVKDEIKALEARIKEVHKRLLAGHPGDETGAIAAALQAELDGLLSDLASIGSELTVTNKDGKTSQPLRDAGLKAAQALVKELDLRAARFEEREDTRRGRREAVIEARQLRREAMALVRALVKDPADTAARTELNDILAEMSEIVYLEAQDQEITDVDPTNGGIIGRRTERVDVIVPYGREQADKIAEMARVRFGTTLDEMDRMTQASGLTRDDKENLIQAIKDRLARRAAAARESDTFSRRGDDVKELLAMLRRLDASGQVAEAEERQKLRSTGGRRAMMDDSEQGRRMFAFFDMIQPTADPVTGEMKVDTASVARAIRLVTYPSWATYYREYGIVAMLSSPTTWGFLGVNTIGQLLNAVISPTRFMLKLGIDKVRGDVFGAQRTVYGSEVGAALRVLTPELIRNTVKDAGSIWWNGRSVRQLNDAAESGDAANLRPEYLVDWTDREGAGWRALHLLARIGHMSSLRILKAADEFFGSIAYAMAYEAQLERKVQQTGKSRLDVVNDPVLMDDVVRRVGHIQKSLLFQEQGKVLTKVNTVLYTLSGERDPKKRTGWHNLADVTLSTYVPFTTVPFNSLKQSIELSGLGSAYHLVRAAEKGLVKGYGDLGKATAREAAERDESAARMRALDPDNDLGKRRALYESEEISDHLAKAALGAMIQAVGIMLGSAGLITGDEPEEPEGRAIDETEKLPPRSIKIGGRWYSYDSTPFAVPFAMVGNYYDQVSKARKQAEIKTAGGGDGWGPVVQAAGAGVRSAIFHNFFLENILEVMQMTVNPSNRTSEDQVKYAFASPWVTRNMPAILAYFARQGDALERDTRADDTVLFSGNVEERLWNLGKSRLPGARETLAPKMDLLGREVERKQPFGAGLISYSKSQQAQFDALFRVLEKYDITELAPKKTISAPGRNGSEFEITVEEQRIWQKAFGENLRREVAGAYNSDAFKQVYNVPPNQDPTEALYQYQKKLLEGAVSQARAKGAAAVIRTLGETDIDRNIEINRRIAEMSRKKTVSESDLK